MLKDKLTKTEKGFTFLQRKKAEPLLKFLNERVCVSLKGKGKPFVKVAFAQSKANKGFTLVEVLVYSVSLTIISAVIVTFTIQILGVYETSRRIRESTDNARRALDTISQEIRHATKLYETTSFLDSHPGQLSLETTRDLPPGESSTYVDFYLDNGALYMKREDQPDLMVTSDKVRVTNLVFTNLKGPTSRPAIRTKITVEYKDPTTGPKTPVTMTTTAGLRI